MTFDDSVVVKWLYAIIVKKLHESNKIRQEDLFAIESDLK